LSTPFSVGEKGSQACMLYSMSTTRPSTKASPVSQSDPRPP
jgi:hypothetical protein